MLPLLLISFSLNYSQRTSSTSDDDDTGFIGKMKKSGKTIAIFFGSQTGTGEEFANRLAKDAMRYGLKALVLDPEGLYSFSFYVKLILIP